MNDSYKIPELQPYVGGKPLTILAKDASPEKWRLNLYSKAGGE